jgi:uncharacterized protein
MSENIIHDENDLRFYLSFGEDEAELTYSYPCKTIMDFDYTFVPKSCRGEGVADKLVKAGLEFAKCQNFKVIASCPVVESFINRNPEYKTIVKEV